MADKNIESAWDLFGRILDACKNFWQDESYVLYIRDIKLDIGEFDISECGFLDEIDKSWYKFLDEFKKRALLFDKNNFDRILIKTPLENYTDWLWYLGISFKIAIYRHKEIQIRESNERDYLIELTKGLLFFMENESIKIKITSPKSFVEISNEQSIDVITNSLLLDFEAYKLNEIPMKYETGEKLLNSGRYKGWIINYVMEGMIEYEQSFFGGRPCYISKGDLMDIDIDIDKNIDKDMIEYFIMDETEPVDNIDIDFLKWRLNELENPKDKGAPIKNYHLAYLLKEILTLLHRKPTNDDFRLIFDYCIFFNLIDNGIKSNHQYIKAIYHKYKDMINE